MQYSRAADPNGIYLPTLGPAIRRLLHPEHVVRVSIAFVVVCLECAAGCESPNSAPRPAKDFRSLPSFDADVVYGVADPGAPNSILREWIRPRNAEPTAEVSAETLDMLLKDSEILDVHRFRVGERERVRIQNSQKLRWLWLGESMTAENLRWIASLTQLRGLSFRYAHLEKADLSTLSPLTELQWLDVSAARMTSTEFQTLPEFRHLQTLHMGSETNDDWIPSLNRLPSLKSLILEHAEITDRGIQDLVEMHPNLQSLDLYMVRKISDKSVDELLKLKRLTFLAVGLSGICPTVMENANLRVLRKGLPECYIDFGG